MFSVNLEVGMWFSEYVYMVVRCRVCCGLVCCVC